MLITGLVHKIAFLGPRNHSCTLNKRENHFLCIYLYISLFYYIIRARIYLFMRCISFSTSIYLSFTHNYLYKERLHIIARLPIKCRFLCNLGPFGWALSGFTSLRWPLQAIRPFIGPRWELGSTFMGFIHINVSCRALI